MAMFSLVFRIGAFIVGVVLIVLGIVGLFLPFLQGILLIALGLSVLSLVSKRAARLLERLKSWFKGRWQKHGDVPG